MLPYTGSKEPKERTETNPSQTTNKELTKGSPTKTQIEETKKLTAKSLPSTDGEEAEKITEVNTSGNASQVDKELTEENRSESEEKETEESKGVSPWDNETVKDSGNKKNAIASLLSVNKEEKEARFLQHLTPFTDKSPADSYLSEYKSSNLELLDEICGVPENGKQLLTLLQTALGILAF